jgi:hypothetical protein
MVKKNYPTCWCDSSWWTAKCIKLKITISIQHLTNGLW